MQERWADVDGYGGIYQVSDHGRIRSYCGKRWGNPPRQLPRVLKPGLDGAMGYLAVNLAGPTGIKRGRIHRLVAAAFIGPCPNGQEVRHLDGDPKNNHLSNLAYGTRRTNRADSIGHGTISRGEHRPGSKLTADLIQEIRAAYSTGRFSQRALASKYGVNHQTIGNIVTYRSWRHV